MREIYRDYEHMMRGSDGYDKKPHRYIEVDRQINEPSRMIRETNVEKLYRHSEPKFERLPDDIRSEESIIKQRERDAREAGLID